MFCKYCGSQLHDDAKFCTKCGNNVEEVQTQAEAQPQPEAQYTPEPEFVQAPVPPTQGYQYGYQQPRETSVHDSAEASSKQGSILTMGILSLAFACTFVLSFLGIIFGAIAKGKANDYIRVYGATKGRATVGRSLGKAGLIAGIVMTAIFALYLILIISICAEYSSSSYYYYY